MIPHPTQYYKPLTEELVKFNKLQLLDIAEQNALTLTTNQIIKYHSTFIQLDHKQYGDRIFKLKPSQELQDHIYAIQEQVTVSKKSKKGDPYTKVEFKYKHLTIMFVAYVIVQECNKIVEKIKSI